MNFRRHEKKQNVNNYEKGKNLPFPCLLLSAFSEENIQLNLALLNNVSKIFIEIAA